MPAEQELWATANDQLKHGSVAVTGDWLYHRLNLVAELLAEVPAGIRGPRLIWRTDKQSVKTCAVDRQLEIGRNPRCDIVADDGKLSRRHCAIAPVRGGFVLRDLSSTNGTRVNSIKTSGQLLRSGDVIEAGSLTIAFVMMV